MNPAIANTQFVKKFDADGFAALPGFVQGEALQELLQHVDHFIRDVVPTMPPEHVFYEDKTRPETLKQLQNLSGNDAWFENLFTSGLFRELAELLLKGPVIPQNLQYFNKPAGIGKPTPPHQDGYYFMLNPARR